MAYTISISMLGHLIIAGVDWDFADKLSKKLAILLLTEATHLPQHTQL